MISFGKKVAVLRKEQKLSQQEKDQVYFNLDAVIREIESRRMYAVAK